VVRLDSLAGLCTVPLLGWRRHFAQRRRPKGFRIRPFVPGRRGARKPDWVRCEVLRLKALVPEAGSRTIGALFNRLYASRRRMTVSKSYVAYTVRDHRHEIELLRRRLKHRAPRYTPKNCVWAVDLTGKGDSAGDLHSILGIEDHGTRRLLSIKALENKNAWTLLGHLFLAIGRFGKSRAIRSDNESMFRSFVFRTTLRFAGIVQQFTVPGCPWQNGRIERLFGTLKRKLDRIEIDSREALKGCLPALLSGTTLFGRTRTWTDSHRTRDGAGSIRFVQRRRPSIASRLGTVCCGAFIYGTEASSAAREARARWQNAVHTRSTIGRDRTRALIEKGAKRKKKSLEQPALAQSI
jgi:transposase InsO family protein